jgi:hypothetical protein
MPTHEPDGTRYIEASNYEGHVFTCLCGEKRENLDELEEHIAEETTKEALLAGINDLRSEVEYLKEKCDEDGGKEAESSTEHEEKGGGSEAVEAPAVNTETFTSHCPGCAEAS